MIENVIEHIRGMSAVNWQGVFVYIIGFYHTIHYWKNIWKAACGGNGMPQPEELTKLGSFYWLGIHIVQYQFFGHELSLELIGVLGAILGVLGSKDYFMNRNNSVSGDETER